jgi:hypothetical protein
MTLGLHSAIFQMPIIDLFVFKNSVSHNFRIFGDPADNDIAEKDFEAFLIKASRNFYPLSG